MSPIRYNLKASKDIASLRAYAPRMITMICECIKEAKHDIDECELDIIIRAEVKETIAKLDYFWSGEFLKDYKEKHKNDN